jgi:hypothetical protein
MIKTKKRVRGWKKKIFFKHVGLSKQFKVTDLESEWATNFAKTAMNTVQKHVEFPVIGGVMNRIDCSVWSSK